MSAYFPSFFVLPLLLAGGPPAEEIQIGAPSAPLARGTSNVSIVRGCHEVTPSGDGLPMSGRGVISVPGRNTHARQFPPDGRMLVLSRAGRDVVPQRARKRWLVAARKNAPGITPDSSVVVSWDTNPAGQTEALRAGLKPTATPPSLLTGDYLGQPPPGAEPEVFARGIVSTDDNEHSAPSFSPDGNEVFWFANRPPGPGNEKWLSFSRTARRENGRWSAPGVAPLGGMVTLSSDGRRAYFDAQRDLWVAEKQGSQWGEPRCLGITARFPELKAIYMPSVTRGGALYFIGHAPGLRGELGIYRAELVHGEYGRPELLPRCINLPPFGNWAPFIAPDESFLLFSSGRDGSLDKSGDIYVSRRQADGGWSDPVSLGEPVNTPRQEVFPGLSPDGKYLFFCRDTPDHQNDVYWVRADSIPALRRVTNPSPGNPK